MHYYTPAQVLKRLSGLTIRELIDMSEKKIIFPAIESSGQGSSRQYSEENLLQIAVAVTLRKVFNPATLKFFMENDYDKVLEYDILLFRMWPKMQGNTPTFYSLEALKYDDQDGLKSLYTANSMRLKGFMSLVLYVSEMREFLKS
jgi:hypothetical protein